MKQIVIIIGLAALAGLVWLGVRATNGSASNGKRVENVAKVERRTIELVVEAVGEINPANQISVKPEVSGRVQSIPVEAGQAVKQGDLLVALDETDLLTERESVQTEIAGAKLELEKAQKDFERNQRLFGSKLVSQEQFDNAKTEMALASNDFEKTQKRLQSVEDKLKKVRIVAPFAGTVLSVPVSQGQVVSGAAGANQGTEMMTFADLNEMIIRAHINQVDVTKIQPGMVVKITADSIPDVALEGKVMLIAPVATVRNSVKGFAVDVLITRTDPRIRPGMNANLRFPVAVVEHALAVPIAAVFVEGKEKVVYLQTPGGAERRVIEVGVSDYQHTEIHKGVSEGDTVLLERPA